MTVDVAAVDAVTAVDGVGSMRGPERQKERQP